MKNISWCQNYMKFKFQGPQIILRHGHGICLYTVHSCAHATIVTARLYAPQALKYLLSDLVRKLCQNHPLFCSFLKNIFY